MTVPAVCPTCGQPPMSAERRLREEIRDVLYASDVTQKTIAETLGYSQKHISQLLNGQAGLSVDMAEKILAVLGRRLEVGSAPIGDPS